MPLKGLAIGDGMCDPVNQLDLGDFLYQTGLVDEESLSTLEKLANVTRGQIENEEWTMATTV
jgi:vitellogenic carboxypeptidase-like protein